MPKRSKKGPRVTPKARKAQQPAYASLSTDQAVALVAPAFSFNPDLLAQGRAFLESHYGLKTVTLEADAGPLTQHAYFAGDDQRREDELFHWLTSPDIKGVIAIRGGYGCARIYPRLIERLKAHARKHKLQPKYFQGYSDLTIMLNGLYQDLGWVTFHGPVVAGKPFREPLVIEEQTFRQCAFTGEGPGAISEGLSVLVRGKTTGHCQAPLVGGNLSLVVASLGTPYEIKTDDNVLFLEDVDEKPYRLDRMVTQLLHAGKLDRVKGIIFGELTDCEPAPRDPSKSTAIDALKLALAPLLAKRQIPIVTGFPAGHGSPQITFPIGAVVSVTAQDTQVEIRFQELR